MSRIPARSAYTRTSTSRISHFRTRNTDAATQATQEEPTEEDPSAGGLIRGKPKMVDFAHRRMTVCFDPVATSLR